MQEAPFPPNEAERLFTLRALNLLDTPMEERFERITRIVRDALNVPIATVTLLDDTRQWFKSCPGLDASETSRKDAFCAHAILAPDLMIVEDATKDERFHDNPLVIAGPQIRFYAGIPIKVHDTLHIGTLCAIDTKPRELTVAQKRIMHDLAKIVESEISAISLQLLHVTEHPAKKSKA